MIIANKKFNKTKESNLLLIIFKVESLTYVEDVGRVIVQLMKLGPDSWNQVELLFSL